MIEYRGEVIIKTDGLNGKPTEIHHSSNFYNTKEQVEKWFKLEREYSTDVGNEILKEKIITCEVNMTDNEDVAEREGYKSFGVTIWEEAKYYKQYWAKDKEAMETEDATEMISNDFSDGLFEWCKGSEEWDIEETHNINHLNYPAKENK